MDQLTHICLIYPREVEILPHRWNQLRSPPLFPVKGEPFLSRQNRRSGLTETTASFAPPGLPKRKKRVYVLLQKEFLCFLPLAIPGRCSLHAIHQCVCSAGKKCHWPRWWLRDEKGWSTQWFLLSSSKCVRFRSPFLIRAGKDVNRNQSLLKITLLMSCMEPAWLSCWVWLLMTN